MSSGGASFASSRGIAASISTTAPQGKMPAAIQRHLLQEQRTIAHEVDTLTPPQDGAWVGIGSQNGQARMRQTANGYEVQLFTHGSDSVQEGLFDNSREGLKKARRAIRGHLGV